MKTVEFKNGIDSGVIALSAGQLTKCKKAGVKSISYSLGVNDPNPYLNDESGIPIFQLDGGKLKTPQGF